MLEGYDFGAGCRLFQEQIINSVKLYCNSLREMAEIEQLAEVINFDVNGAAMQVFEREEAHE